MDKLSAQQRHNKAAIKREQNDACISSAEREQTRPKVKKNYETDRSWESKGQALLCRRPVDMRLSNMKAKRCTMPQITKTL